MLRLRAALPLLLAVLAAACAPQRGQLASAPARESGWAFERSDVPVDPAFRFGQLPSGLRYIVRHNATPRGTALVRMEVAAGSLNEADSERGFAHFVEHMAFNGSTQVPEGEMIPLLERHGLAFGADTNAETSFDRTTYKLDLPRADPALLDLAVKLMRETASELTFSPEAVERERGVIMAERRDRNTWQLRNMQAQADFQHPGALYTRRFPIGSEDTLKAASADTLRAFWRREYVPAQTTLIIVGDMPVETMEAAVRQHFGSWHANGEAQSQTQPDAGPVSPHDKGRTAIYIDPALSERVIASRHGKWLKEPDTVIQRQENLLRQIGYGVVNRRLLRLSRQPDPPLRSGGLGTADTFKAARTTNLVIDTPDGKWRRGIQAAVAEYRRAMRNGISPAELEEQAANLRTASEDAAASAETRSHAALVNQAFALIRDNQVPSTPQTGLERLKAFLPTVTPAKVLAALKREAVPLKQPLLRFQGRKAPDGGERALRAVWDEAMRKPITRGASAELQPFAYTDFGPAGQVTEDRRDAAFGIRQIRFANGLRLNLKRTEIEKDRVALQVVIDGGEMLRTRAQPLATDMMPFFASGGLGKHSNDELMTILAGHNVGVNAGSGGDAFVMAGQTTPRDLDLQLRLMTAFIADPGYRPEAEVQYRQNVNNYFARAKTTPSSALSHVLGGILSDYDPRFSFQPVEAYRKLTFAQLRTAISDRLTKGAMELALVGDFDEEAAVAMVARSLGALPAREAEFRPYIDQRQRPFAADRSRRVVRHEGPADQALLRLTWPTRDDSDLREVLVLELLQRVTQISLSDTLREKLGQAYSPGASSAPSAIWRGYGTFGVAASINVADVDRTRAAIAGVITDLRSNPPPADLLSRARQPMLEKIDNALKSNAGWLALTARAQSQPDRLTRHARMKAELSAVTAADVQAMARRYLTNAAGLEVLVLPQGATAP